MAAVIIKGVNSPSLAHSTPADTRRLDEPLVTIMVPTYNGAPWIRDTLASATAQTHRRLRILVSDDRSTDGTRDLVARAADADPRIQLIETSGRLRWVGNTNHLLDHIEGDYACFLMHDDLIVEDYVATLLAAVKAQSSPAVAYGDMQPFSEEGLCPPWRSALMQHARHRVTRCIAVLLERYWTVALRGLAPVSVLHQAPRPRVHGRGEYGADGPWIAALALCASFVRVPQVLYFKRRHDTGVTAGWRRTRPTAAELTRSYQQIVREVPLTRRERAVIDTVLAARLAVVRAGVAKSHFQRLSQREPRFTAGQPNLRRRP